MLTNKSKNGMLKQKYRKVLESSLMISLITVAFLFYSFKTFKHENKLPVVVIEEMEWVNIPPTKQNKPKPPPIRPQYPIETEDEEFNKDVTIADGDKLFSDYIANSFDPPQVEDEIIPFEKVQQKPVLIEFAKPYYPEMARKVGIEGTVTIKVLIDTKGNVEKTEIFKSIPMLDEAAVEAAKKCIFKPAKQRDKFVKVWMSIPFKFKLQ